MDKLTNFEKKLIKAFINKVDGCEVVVDKDGTHLRVHSIIEALTEYLSYSHSFGYISFEEWKLCDCLLLNLKSYAIRTAKKRYSLKYDEFIDILKYGYPCKIVEE